MSAGYRSHFGSQRFSPRITDRTNKGAELFRSGAYYNPSNLLVSLSIRPLGSARSEEHTSELQSLMRISYAVFCLKKKKQNKAITENHKSDDNYTECQ